MKIRNKQCDHASSCQMKLISQYQNIPYLIQRKVQSIYLVYLTNNKNVEDLKDKHVTYVHRIMTNKSRNLNYPKLPQPENNNSNLVNTEVFIPTSTSANHYNCRHQQMSSSTYMDVVSNFQEIDIKNYKAREIIKSVENVQAYSMSRISVKATLLFFMQSFPLFCQL